MNEFTLPLQIKDLKKNKKINDHITISGWLKSKRDSKSISFLDLTDGSNIEGIQIIAEESLNNYSPEITNLSTGCSLEVTGLLQESMGKGQDYEIKATKITILGLAPAQEYPLQKKRHSFEYLRSVGLEQRLF